MSYGDDAYYEDDYRHDDGVRLTRRGRAALILTIFLGIVIAIGIGGYIFMRSIGVYGDTEPGKSVTFTIPRGSTSSDIGQILVDNGVIKSKLGWRITMFTEGGVEDVQAGEYTIPTNLTPRAALAALLDTGPAGEPAIAVTFQEGLWLTEMADIVSERAERSGEKFLRVLENGKVTSKLKPEGVDSMEGLLFPSTYQIAESEGARDIARKMVEEMEARVDALDKSRLEELGVTPYELIVIASMIEAETRVDKERGMVARVIYNRLEQGIPLGIDATYLYALGERKDSLTESDLAIESPYNLRKYAGLPPTAIGAPGQESLEAAADPADGDWLFYVLADCEGNHAFSETNAEFLQDKAAYLALEC